MQCKFIRAAAVMALASALNVPAALAQAGKVETLDRIVAVVNDEVITKHEMESQKQLVIAQLKRSIANFKVPKRVHVIAELPRNQMGKVQKNVLREQYGAAA